LKTLTSARWFALAAVPMGACAAFGLPALGQSLEQSPVVGANASSLPNRVLAQLPSQTSSGTQQFDLTPVTLPERGSAFGSMQSFKTNALYYLPSKMFLNATVENSLRLETNVLQTQKRNHLDMIYRVLPNVTLGYAINRTTRVAMNYFFFRDQYMSNASLLSRNIHSVGFRGDKDFIISPKTTVTTSFFARELFISEFDELSDLLPSVTVVRRVGRGGAIYGSALGQIRFRDVFSRFQEGDTFFSMGAVYRTPRWTLVADNTVINNYGVPALRGGVSNNTAIVTTLEAGRKISQRLPLTAFIRAEPIYNIGQASRAGFAGVNFRLFGGIRTEISKPAIFPVALRSG